MQKADEYLEITNGLESRKKGLTLTTVAAASSSLFLWGIILYLANAVYTWVPSGSYGDLYIAVAAIGLMSGNLVMGFLSDMFGRRRIFIFTMFMAVVGLYGAILSRNYIEMFISIFIANFSLGGDETVILAYIGESISHHMRSQYIVLITNMANIGVFFTAVVEYFVHLDITLSKEFIFTIVTITLAVVIVTRWKSMESPMWTKLSSSGAKFQEDDALKLWKGVGKHTMALSIFEQISTATTIVTGFFMLNLYFGTIYAGSIQSYFVVFTTMAGATSGILLAFWVNRVPHRMLPLFSFPLMAALLIFLAAYSSYVLVPASIILIILVVRAFLSEIGWGSREVLQVELNHTMRRGTRIGLVRSFAYGIFIIIYLLTTFINKSMEFYFVLLAIVELFGAAGAISWYIWGVETGTEAIL